MQSEEAVSEPLSVPLTVPLVWRAGAVLSSQEAGPAVLRALATTVALAERPPAINEEAAGLELEVARLHQKTQLLIELLALALGRTAERPASVSVQLSGYGCSWPTSDESLSRGSQGTVALWLHPAAPEPVVWPARIVELAVADGGVLIAHAQFLPLGEAAQSALDRHVFQLHRRAIAEAKRVSSS